MGLIQLEFGVSVSKKVPIFGSLASGSPAKRLVYSHNSASQAERKNRRATPKASVASSEKF